MIPLQIYTHSSGLYHDTGPGHPESPQRLKVVQDMLAVRFADVPVVTAREAQWDELLLAHDAAYLEKLQDAMPERGLAYLDGDTVISPRSWDAAVHAAGAVIQAVDDVLAGACRRAFCAVRPPGHHAFPDHAEGFCLLNNVFIGARWAKCKVAILDFDVHHGNGSDAMARKHDGIFYASTHQWPLYPGTGLPQDDRPGRVRNIPLKAGSGGEEFRTAWRLLLQDVAAFQPELIMISAGFDAHRDDPLANINLVEDDFAWVTREICALADAACGGRVVSVMEGGYNLAALESSVAVHVEALLKT